MIRAEHINESYYEKRNAPTYNQFVGRYHFVDDIGRQYMLAEKHTKVARPLFKPRNTRLATQSKECVTNTHGYIKLYVKLPHTRTIHWFTHNDVNRIITLYDIKDKNNTYDVTFRSSDKSDYRSATGSIYIQGISPSQCNVILNR